MHLMQNEQLLAQRLRMTLPLALTGNCRSGAENPPCRFQRLPSPTYPVCKTYQRTLEKDWDKTQGRYQVHFPKCILLPKAAKFCSVFCKNEFLLRGHHHFAAPSKSSLCHSQRLLYKTHHLCRLASTHTALLKSWAAPRALCTETHSSYMETAKPDYMSSLSQDTSLTWPSHHSAITWGDTALNE